MAMSAVGKHLVPLTLLLCGAVHAQQEVTEYAINSAESRVYWLVYSAGVLSRLGHNHVISAPTLSGTIHLDPQLPQSRFSIEIPVAMLVVDDAALRAELGNGFTGEPSTNDIEGTRRNMLSDRLLNAGQYPVLQISGTGPLGEADSQVMNVSVTVAGNTAELMVPVTVRVDGDTISAEGVFQLTHEEIGLRPFSALMGTLKVAEQMDFSYYIVGRRL
ncbi:MAG: YceI family protein [Gammaproteobacteria bacterium]|nr:YceI family protein [Gammaproteobacteria bacterium]MDP2141478.1 YceI family protein [Gammaproteobacteria bacterium]MDP2347497.1 YceI family protein [Gammaproteobacteria bacterium]